MIVSEESLYKQQQFEKNNKILLDNKFIVVDRLAKKKKPNEVSIVYYRYKQYFDVEYNTNTGQMLLRSYLGNIKKKGKCYKYSSVTSLLNKVNQLVKGFSLEEKYNKPTKDRLIYQGKIISDSLADGISLSKACKLANIEYTYGKMLVEEGFVK